MPPSQQRQKLAEETQYRCGYCLLQERVSGIPLTIEHVVPKVRGGSDHQANLWLSCRTCNEKKGIRVEAVDPVTGATVPLFNPRTEKWDTHFRWSTDGTEMIGETPTGRATVVALDLNEELRVRARRIWVLAGWHPAQ